MNIKTLEVSNYGMFLLSLDVFSRYLKDNKVRSKKVLEYFQKDNDIYIDSISKGIWFPLLPIDSTEYIIGVGNDNPFNNEWVEIHRETAFNVSIGKDNSLWIGSIGLLSNFSTSQFEGKSELYYHTLDEEMCYNAFKFQVEEGFYKVDIIGYKKEQVLAISKANYGFLFILKPVKEFNGFKDPREDEKYNFNIAQI